jgi:hypothetical protein
VSRIMGILGPNGEPVGTPRVATARISGRKALEHEPRDVVVEVEVILAGFEQMKRLAALVNDCQLALSPWVTMKAPVVKVRIFCDKDRVPQAFSYAKGIAALGGGEVSHEFVQDEKKPGEDSGAESGGASSPG